MADSKSLNLLVVEDDLEDEQLLCEALTEIEENRLWCNWLNACIVQVEQLSDALDCMRLQRFDAVLLNISLPDCPALLDAFLEANTWAQGAPILILADEEDENLANRLLREGAEDVILKSELDCRMLARSIRYAIERRRRTQGESSLTGDAVGVLSGPVFRLVAPHILRLVLPANIDLHLAIIEIRDLPAATSDDREARELFVIRAEDLLRDVIPTPSLIGRIEKCCFAVIVAGVAKARAEALLAQAAEQIEEVLRCLVAATVTFSVHQLSEMGSIEELLNHQKVPDSPLLLKTAMLAD